MRRPTSKRARTRSLPALALAVGASSVLALFSVYSLAASAATAPALSIGRGCYLVGQTVELRGTGFAPARTYVVTIDGVYLGRRTTDARGSFSIPIHPGGLPAGSAQHVDQLEVTDGTGSAKATFTLTRDVGARILTSGGSLSTLRGRFQIWGFSPGGGSRSVYVHYVSPSGHVRKTVSLGRTGGQCGYLQTAKRRVFPLAVSRGTWTLQLDTRGSYSRHPGRPVTRIRVAISG